MEAASLDVEARPQFAALCSGFIFADNAGGSQCLTFVAHKVSDYLLHSNAQLGASYSVSRVSTDAVTKTAPLRAAEYFNAPGGPDEVVFGPSATQLTSNLSMAMEGDVQEGDEIVVSLADHETNVGAWVRLAKRKGLTLKYWRPTSLTRSSSGLDLILDPQELAPLLSKKTRLVAFSACSNILGHFTDVKAVVGLVKQSCGERAQVVVDCVAYAPHRRVDVKEWGVDFAFFSFYKVYGAHVSVLYASLQAQRRLSSIAHFFIPPDSTPYKLQPGGPGYELAASTPAVFDYLLSLSPDSSFNSAFGRIAIQEQSLTEPLLECLRKWKSRGVRIVGPESHEASVRAPTVSFVVVEGDQPTPGKLKVKLKSEEIVKHFDAKGDIGARFGHFYAARLVKDVLGLDLADGVVRISLVHYNTVEEVGRIVAGLDELFDERL